MQRADGLSSQLSAALFKKRGHLKINAQNKSHAITANTYWEEKEKYENDVHESSSFILDSCDLCFLLTQEI